MRRVNPLSVVLGALCVTLPVIACSSDDDNDVASGGSAGSAGSAGKAGNAGASSGGKSGAAGSTSSGGAGGASAGAAGAGAGGEVSSAGSAGAVGGGGASAGASGNAGAGGAVTLPVGCPGSVGDYNVVRGTAADEQFTTGLDARDLVLAEGGKDRLASSAQADCYVGGDGDDRIETRTGAGLDVTIGGEGADVFLFASKSSADMLTIIDFSEGSDKLHFSEAVFGELGTTGNPIAIDHILFAGSVGTGTSTGEGSTAVIGYNGETGKIYWDSDGSGSAAPVHIGTLANKPSTIKEASFIVED